MTSDLPLILVTNDDGIRSPGLLAAASALDALGELLIVAPSTQQSGMSRSLPAGFDGRIYPTTLIVNERRVEAYHLDGSPAQSVLYGVLELAPRRPDLVVSGINYGENLGSAATISGTVGAALQGGDMGIPSLAISLETRKEYHYNPGDDVDWANAAYWLDYFARRTLDGPTWPPDVAALKIDIPDSATRATRWRVTRQSRQSYYRARPMGRRFLTDAFPMDYEVAIDRDHLEPDSDIYAFAIQRIISVTPLSVNLTAREPLAQFERLLRK